MRREKMIDFHSQHNEMAQVIGDRRSEAMSLGNLGLTLEKIDEHFNALQNHKKEKAIFEELKLDHMVQ